jgi:hypothetical protein
VREGRGVQRDRGRAGGRLSQCRAGSTMLHGWATSDETKKMAVSGLAGVYHDTRTYNAHSGLHNMGAHEYDRSRGWYRSCVGAAWRDTAHGLHGRP